MDSARASDLDIRVVTVFGDGPGGGNPAPIVLDAVGVSDEQMQDVARSFGHESAFVVDPVGTGCDVALRFWVPRHEMPMCGHATLGAVWLLVRLGRLRRPTDVRVHTASGAVRALVAADGGVTISQPAGRVEVVREEARVLEALGIARSELAERPIYNATTSRTKTLVPVSSSAVLDALSPDADGIESACAAIGSTGLYPYAPSGERRFDARQFPRSSGYPEDPATGVAAAALAFGVLADGIVDIDERALTVRQGRAMGRPSKITVHYDLRGKSAVGCWLGGSVASSETLDAPGRMIPTITPSTPASWPELTS